MLDKLDNYKLSTGKKYKEDYGAINTRVVGSWEEYKKKNNIIYSKEDLKKEMIKTRTEDEEDPTRY
jgi:hypothetical protein